MNTEEDRDENLDTTHPGDEYSAPSSAANRTFGTVLHSRDDSSIPNSPSLSSASVDENEEPTRPAQQWINPFDFYLYESQGDEAGASDLDGMALTRATQSREDDPHYPGFDIYHDEEEQEQENMRL